MNKEVDPAKTFNVHSSMVEKLWRPDVYITEGREGYRHDVATDNLALDIQVWLKYQVAPMG